MMKLKLKMMMKTRKKRIPAAWLLALALLAGACGTVGKATSPADAPVARRELSPEQQRKYDYFFLEATRLKVKQDYTGAFGLLRHCLEIDPNGASALYEMSQYYMFLRQTQKGQDALEQAVANAPDNYWYAQGLANLYQQQQQTDKAIELLERMSVRFPTKQDPLFALLDIYGKQERYHDVIGTLDRLERRLGKNEQLSMEKFRAYLRMKDNHRALQEIEALTHEYPSDARYQVILGDLYLQNGKTREAYDIYQKVLKTEPDNPSALYSMASYYDQTGQQELYHQQLDTLLLNEKVAADVKTNIMRQMIAANEQTGTPDSTRLINLFDRMILTEQDDAQVPMLYAQYLFSKDQQEKAVPALEQAIDIDPANKMARLMIVSASVKTEDYKRIIRVCESGIEAIPDALELYYYLAIAYNQAERPDSVLSVCRKALEHVTPETKDSEVSDFYAILGDTYQGKKLMREAYAAYDSALVYNPDNVGVLNNYAYYLSLERRDLDKAEEMSYRTVKAQPNNATFLDTYAWVLFEKRKYTEARVYIDNAIKNDTEKSSVLLEHGGDIYFMNGDVEKAMDYWRQALEQGTESTTLERKIKTKKYIPE